MSINDYFSSSLYGFLVFGMMLSRAEAQTLADVFELCINQKIILSLPVFYTQPNPNTLTTLHCGNCRMQELSVTLTQVRIFRRREKYHKTNFFL